MLAPLTKQQMQLDTIYNEDCLEGMKRIPDGSIDAIICDLPYGVLNKQSEGGGWDSIIPFEPLWEQYLRVLKENGAILLFCQGMFTAKLMMSQPNLWRYNLIWDKSSPTGFLNAKRMPMRRHEDIAVFYRSLPTYNPQMLKCEPYQRNHSKGRMTGKHTNNCYGKFVDFPTTISDEKYPTSIIFVPKEHKMNCDDNFHPTQKPVQLLRYLVRTYTNEGDTVLDNCMGSGTTAIACIKEKRHFIGFELNKEYYDKAMTRIENELAMPALF